MPTSSPQEIGSVIAKASTPRNDAPATGAGDENGGGRKQPVAFEAAHADSLALDAQLTRPPWTWPAAFAPLDFGGRGRHPPRRERACGG